MTRADILATAAKLVTSDREKDHGRWADNAIVTAALWRSYLRGRAPEAEDVAYMLALLKIARRATNGPNADTSIDIAGYAALGGELDAL